MLIIIRYFDVDVNTEGLTPRLDLGQLVLGLAVRLAGDLVEPDRLTQQF